ncbi:MAG: hypothetical protein V1672_04460 [Candidatus Diapherotrites archaeon]
MKDWFGIALLLLILVSGCTTPTYPVKEEPEPVCGDAITYGVDAQGACAEFPTTCLPEGYTKVNECIKVCEPKCDDKCQGTTFLTEGECENGECIYKNVKENSFECGYEKIFDGEVTLQYCNYNEFFDRYSFFLSVRSTGEILAKAGSSVWLMTPDIDKTSYQPISKEYAQGIYWWQDVFSDKPYRGRTFNITGEEEFKEFDYKFIYCELENNLYDKCDEEKGIILYTGNTADCNIVKY